MRVAKYTLKQAQTSADFLRTLALADHWQLEEASMNGATMTLARYYAKQAVKEQWRAAGLKLQNFEASELSRAANAHLDNHPELIAIATERYRDFVKRGLLQPPRNRRKASQ
jgi:hypothetical protein